MQKPGLPLRAKAGMAIAAGLSLWGMIAYYDFESAYQQQFHDPYSIASQEQGLAGVIEAVPPDATLGYLTDAAPGSVASITMFDAAQYVLVPRILEQGTKPDRVLGYYNHPHDFASIAREHGLELERDFGNGTLLFRRQAR